MAEVVVLMMWLTVFVDETMSLNYSTKYVSIM